ncbi:SusC/RagA family TonB-linked outer membrane protein [Niabella ginsenosidivorans]|uniref:SusC/RagA family TonB-linked outer membrane protein n=1 Tax=Niabella ginsenosidivorans TaxID=1176587 RepID=A0A1A9I779_9BACT|nr:TonB-dependent receptor [Niabella ginsenosidivorans]ANH82560.1 SusC/RagA family TonB-linked outer membrane protein [Niabella ginsenosidivorans]
MKSLLFVIICIAALYQQVQAQRSLSGKVTEAGVGTPVQGATVQVKGTNTITVTDENGAFELKNVPEKAVLVFSSVNYLRQEYPVGNEAMIAVSLEPDNTSLDEVMVIAYGTAKKGTYTGSVSTLSANDIKDPPNTTFENALNGKVAGLQFSQTSGQAGSASDIRIRGIGSMNASKDPLYVIDGVPVISGNSGQMSDYNYTTNNIMNSLNPDDIESISVLKDAAASSLYGSRAANGVIIVTTKKGKLGKPVISLKTSLGFSPSWATDNYEPASVQDQVNMLYSVFYDYSIAGGASAADASASAINRLNGKFNMHGYYFEAPGTGRYENIAIKGMTDGIENRDGKYFDWNKVLFRTGLFTTNDISVSGGNDNTTYYSSLSYTKDKNRVAVNELERVAGRVNLTQKIGKIIEFSSNVNVAKYDKTGFNDSRNLGLNYFLESRNLLWPLYWPTDYKTGAPFTDRYGSYAYNDEYYNTLWNGGSRTLSLSAIEGLTVKILPTLNVKSIFSYNNSSVKDHLYYSPLHFNGQASDGSVDDMSTTYTKMVSSTTVNYNEQFGKNDIGFLAGFEGEKNVTDFLRASGTNLATSSLQTPATAGKTVSNGYSWGNNLMSVLSRLEYNYDQRYYLSGSFRRDGTSRVAPDTRWANFWSVAGSWRIDKEKFFNSGGVVSNLRVRASYGTNGTMPSNDFGWRSLIYYNTDSRYNEQPGGLISSFGNDSLTWEKSKAANIALEFGLFNQRLTGTIEYFNKNTDDLIQSVPISTVTGISSILSNIGRINNRGLEFELAGDLIRKPGLRWSASVNGSVLKSTVKELYGGQPIIWDDPTGDDARAQFIYQEGASMLSFYGYEWAGVDPSTGSNVYYVNDPDNPKGDFEFKGRGATYDYAKAQMVILGTGIPKLYGGFNTDAEYKGFTLALGFIYKIGGKLYDGAFKDVADDGYYWERIRSQYYFENLWTDANHNGTQPQIRGTDLTDAMQYSSRQLYDASFLRLKNITLGYNIPGRFLNKLSLKSGRLFFNGSNLLTMAKYKIADPEVTQYSTRGWELPITKTYTFGLEVSL